MKRLPNELLRTLSTVIIEMKARNGMLVRSEFQAEATCHDFLDHRERKNIVRQSSIGIVRAHVYEQMQATVTSHELQCACTRNVLKLLLRIGRVKYLNYSFSCV
ncbi:MAG: hypothetical protein WC222_12355 [Parachlamydiales bacterium]